MLLYFTTITELQQKIIFYSKIKVKYAQFYGSFLFFKQHHFLSEIVIKQNDDFTYK